MKGKLLYILLFTLLALSACGNGESSGDEQTNAEEGQSEEQSSEQADEEKESDQQINEEHEDIEESDLQEATQKDLSDAEEFDSSEDHLETERVRQEINIDDYEPQVITDNPGTRVVIYMDGEDQIFKSIYVKRNALFKLIDLETNEPVVIDELQ